MTWGYTGYAKKRPPNSTWTVEREEKLCKLYEEGIGIYELTSIFGLTQSPIRNKLRNLRCFGYIKSENKKAKAVEEIIKKLGRKPLTLKDLNNF